MNYRSIIPIILLAISCNQKNASTMGIRLEQLEITLDGTGLSSELRFPFFSDTAGDYIRIYDGFRKGFFSLDLKNRKFTKESSLQNEGRHTLESFTFFVPYKDNFFIFEQGDFYLLPKEGELEKPKLIWNQGIEAKENPGHRWILNSEFGNMVRGLDRMHGILYTLTKNIESEVPMTSLIGVDLKTGTIQPIADALDTNQLSKHQLTFKQGLGNIGNDTSPFVTYSKDKLLISYPFSSELIIYDLKTKSKTTKSFESQIHPNSKETPVLVKDDFQSFFEAVKKWNNDVGFGPVLPFGNNNLFIRIVKGKSKQHIPFDGKVFLTVFDGEFRQVFETTLTDLAPDLDYEYFTAERHIYIRAKSTNEDQLKFYRLTIDMPE